MTAGGVFDQFHNDAIGHASIGFAFPLRRANRYNGAIIFIEDGMTSGIRRHPALLAATLIAVLAWRSPLRAETLAADSDGDGIPDEQDNLPALATLPLHWSVQGVEIRWEGLPPGSSAAWNQTNALTLYSRRERADMPGARPGAAATAGPLDPAGHGPDAPDGLLRLGTFGSDEPPWQALQRTRARRFAANPAGVGRGVELRFEIHFRNLSWTNWHLRGLRVPVLADGRPVAKARPELPALATRGIVFPGGAPQRVYSVAFVAGVPAEQAGALLASLAREAPRFAFEQAEGWIVAEQLPEDLPLSRWFANICQRTVPVKLRGGDGQVLAWRLAREVGGARQRLADWAGTVNRLAQETYGKPFWLEEQGILVSLAGWDTGAWDCWWRLDGSDEAEGWSGRKPARELIFDLSGTSPALSRASRRRAASAAPHPVLLGLLGRHARQKGDAAGALARDRQAAEMGYAPALFRLGAALAQGDGAEKDAAQAAQACRRAAEQGYAPAAAWLGGALLRGDGIARDPAAGFDWLDKAAAQGHPGGLGLLALCLTRGVGVAADAAEGFAAARRAAAMGDATAQLALAIQMMAAGDSEALDWLACAAEAGDAKAQARLARCLDAGEGTARDPKSAVAWYARAAAQGDAAAQLALGRALRSGRGVKRNPRRAAHWFGQAAGQGHPEAQTWWGLALLQGQGVERDTARGIDWIRRAAEQGYPQAQYLLGLCTYAGLGAAPADPAAALPWLKAAAGQQVLPAQILLGYCFYEGSGTAQDRGAAVGLFRQAAEQGSAAGQIWLAHCYAFGEGVETDLDLAREWAQKAWQQGHPGGRQMLRRIPAE